MAQQNPHVAWHGSRPTQGYGRAKLTQSWHVGQTVNVGFVKGLTVVRMVPTPRDGQPDYYELVGAKGQRYTFQPHHGLTRIE